MANSPRLSVLDLYPVAEGHSASRAITDSVTLARRVEELGYTRYWVAEHHNMKSIASAAPEVLIAHVAAVTSRMRIGSGGMMLPNHSPLHVVEIFRTLEALHPDRIDLGIGRAPGTDPLASSALRRGNEDVNQSLAEVLAFAGGTFPANHPYAKIIATPSDVKLPPIWMLGSTMGGARIAAQLGLRYGFAGHFSMEYAEAALGHYREQFEPSPELTEPAAILAIGVICAATDEEAELLALPYRLTMARLRLGKSAPFPTTAEALAHQWTAEETASIQGMSRGMVVGSPERVHKELELLLARHNISELMLSTPVAPLQDRISSFERVAAMFPKPASQ